MTFTPTAERFAVEVSLPVSMTNSQVSRDSGSNLDFPHVYRSTNRAIVAQYTLKAEVEEKMKGTTATSEGNKKMKRGVELTKDMKMFYSFRYSSSNSMAC